MVVKLADSEHLIRSSRHGHIRWGKKGRSASAPTEIGEQKKRRRSKNQGVYWNFSDLVAFSSWLSELWTLAGGGENVKYFAPVIPGVGHHNEKSEPARSSVPLPTSPLRAPPHWSLSSNNLLVNQVVKLDSWVGFAGCTSYWGWH